MRFTETTREHARRLQRSLRWIKIRQRAAILKQQGLGPTEIRDQMGESNCPYYVAETAVDELLKLLAVKREGDEFVALHGTELEHELQQVVEALGKPVTVGQLTRTLARGGNKRALAEAGVVLGAPPYGYRKEGKELAKVAGQSRSVARVVVAMDEAEVFRYIYDAFVDDGASMPVIAEDLNEQGLRTRRGRLWTNDTIRDMLRNPVYAGYVLYQGTAQRNIRSAGELFPGRHPALLTWSEFVAAHERLLEMRGRRERWGCPWKGAPSPSNEGSTGASSRRGRRHYGAPQETDAVRAIPVNREATR